MKKVLFIGFLLTILAFKGNGAADDFSAWNYHTGIYLNTTGSGANVTTEDITDFPVLVKLTNSNFDFTKAKPDGADIRLSKSDNATSLPYVIERWTNGEAFIWVKADTVFKNDQTQYFILHYGNSSATSASNGAAVFATNKNYVGVWNLEGITSDRKLLDRTANNYYGDVSYYPQVTNSDIVDAIIGKGLNFTESQYDAAWLGSNCTNLKNLTHNITVSAWIKADDLDACEFHRIISSAKYSPNWNGFGFGTYGNKLIFTTYNVTDYILNSYSLSTNVWYHVTAVMDASYDVKFYINGQYAGIVYGSSPALAGTDGYLLGASTYWNSNYLSELWDGVIDHIVVSKTARSAAYIKLCYENQKTDQSLVSVQVDDLYTDWNYWTKIRLNTTTSGANANNSLNNFPVLVRLRADNFNFNQADAAGADIRFTKPDNKTRLEYAIARWDKTNQTADVWVKAPVINGNDSTQYFKMYWGKSGVASLSNSSAVFETGNSFTGVWSLDQDPNYGAAGAIKDYTGNQYHGESRYSMNTSNLINGVVGKALNFDPDDANRDNIWLGSSIPLIKSLRNNLTVSAWVKADDLNCFHRIAASTKYPNCDGFGFGTYYNKLIFSTHGIKDYVLDNATITTGAWYHVAAVMNSGNDVTFYVNGQKKGTVYGTYPANEGTYGFLIGATTFYSCNYLNEMWDGAIDQVSLSSTARSDDWIKICYENQKTNQTLVFVEPPDTIPPVVIISYPANGSFTNQNPVAVTWTVDGVQQTTQLWENLTQGANTITRTATDAAGNIGTASINVTLDTQAPVVVITSPANGFTTNQMPVAVTWTVDGVAQTTQLSEDLIEGINTITRTATDNAGNTGSATITVTLYTYTPLCSLRSDPQVPGRTNHPVLFVHGINSDAARTFDVRSLMFYYDQAAICSTVIYDSSALKWQIKFGIVEARLSFNFFTSSCDEPDFRYESKFRLTSFPYHSELQPGDVTAEAQYNETTDKITYSLYDKKEKRIRGETVHFGMLDTLQAMADRPHEQTRYITAFSDRVVGYNEGSIPAYLAGILGLNTTFYIDSPGAGINSNGLYFYNAKRPVMKDTTLYNCSTTVEFMYADPGHYGYIWYTGYLRYIAKTQLTAYFKLSYNGEPFSTAGKKVYGDTVSFYNFERLQECMRIRELSYSTDKKAIYYTRYFLHEPPETGCDTVVDTIDISAYYDSLSYFDSLTLQTPDHQFPWTPAGLVHPDWNETPSKYGQANQLVDRMREVMDDFYGEGQWEDSINKPIDLVCHSQGGLVTRIAIYNSRDTSLANPINHINRIVTMGTPHWGSAFANNDSLLRNGNEDNGGKQYPNFADLKNGLLGNVSPWVLADIDKLELPALVTFIPGVARIRLKDFTVKGTYLGPYTVKGKVLLWWIFNPFFPTLFKLSFTIDPGKDARSGMRDFNKKGEHLGWQAQSDFTKKLVNLVTYPSRPRTGEPFVVTHFYTPAAMYFMANTYDYFMEKVKQGFKDHLLISALFGSAATAFNTQLFKNLQNDLEDVRALTVKLDGELSNDGDIVVEQFSQKGINIGTGFNPNDPSGNFKVKQYTQYIDRITHIKEIGSLNPGYSWETAQAYDVAQELGDSPRILPPTYLAKGALGQSALQSATAGDKIAVSFLNKSVDVLHGFTAEYYVTADSLLQPSLDVINNGGINITMTKCTGNLYKVLFDASGVNLGSMETLPFSDPVEFRLYYNTGTSWSHFDDYSFAYSDSGALVDNVKIVVRDTSGAIVSGIAPDSADIRRMARSACSASSKERAEWDRTGGNTVTQPSLALDNIGSSVVDTVHLYYLFSTNSLPLLTVNPLEQPDKATVFLDTMGQDGTGLKQYAVHVTYRGVNLHPGERIGNINFQISNTNGSLWNYTDDPSFLASDTLVHNANILVLDDEGNRRCGVHPDDFSYDTSSVWDSVSLEAADSSSEYVCRPKIRVKNLGAETLQSFKIYYYFETESGCTPTCGVNPQPGCLATVEYLGGSRHRVVYKCIDVNVEPGEYFPGIDGVIFELRQFYGNGVQNFWGRDNDYSAEGLDVNWQETSRIVVEDVEGNVIWGLHQ